MNGRLSKVDMTARLLKMKRDLDTKSWHREWGDHERWAAQQILNNVLDTLDEYHY